MPGLMFFLFQLRPNCITYRTVPEVRNYASKVRITNSIQAAEVQGLLILFSSKYRTAIFHPDLLQVLFNPLSALIPQIYNVNGSYNISSKFTSVLYSYILGKSQTI